MNVVAPAGFDASDEFPLRELPDVPLYTENFWFVAYDPAARVGVWTHWGRSPWDPTLWRETVLVYLPDGSVLLAKNFGRHETDGGPRACSSELEVIDPWNRGRMRFDGAAVRVKAEQGYRGVVGEGRHFGLRIDLGWQAIAPVWAMRHDDTKDQTWGDTRYEQFCDAVGTVEFEGEKIDFRAVALRDHTRGIRDLPPLSRHCCFNAFFPESRRAFHALLVDIDGAEPLRRAVVMHDGEIIEAEIVHDTSLLKAFEQADEPFEIGLTWPGGSATIEAQVVHNFPLAWSGPNEFILGWDPAVSYSTMFEGFSRYRWDGEEAYGLTERSLRHRMGP